MKETGVIRRIDELGRIVIPKEIRKRLKVGPGDMLDIYTNEDMITLKKYSILDDFSQNIIHVIKALKTDKVDYVITSSQEVLVSTLNLSKGDVLSKEFLKFFLKTSEIELPPSKNLSLTENYQPNKHIIAKKIFKDGDLVGYAIMLSQDSFMKSDKDMFLVLDKYINNYIAS